MAHTEKCRGCGYENSCDYISCRIEENRKIRAMAIDEFANWMYERHSTDLTEYVEWYKEEIAEQMKAGVENDKERNY